jgi:hypothetical protein
MENSRDSAFKTIADPANGFKHRWFWEMSRKMGSLADGKWVISHHLSKLLPICVRDHTWFARSACPTA